MGSKEEEAQLVEYRLNIGREYTSKFKGYIGDGQTISGDGVEDLYNKIAIPLGNVVRRMRRTTLSRIIDAHPHSSPNNAVTPLLSPRKSQHGLESLNFLAMSGRDYLEILAMCAIACAMWDYLVTLKWKLKGKDRECDRYYFFPGEYSSKKEAEAAADHEIQLIKARTGKGVLPDRVYVIQPDGVEYHYVTKEPV